MIWKQLVRLCGTIYLTCRARWHSFRFSKTIPFQIIAKPFATKFVFLFLDRNFDFNSIFGWLWPMSGHTCTWQHAPLARHNRFRTTTLLIRNHQNRSTYFSVFRLWNCKSAWMWMVNGEVCWTHAVDCHVNQTCWMKCYKSQAILLLFVRNENKKTKNNLLNANTIAHTAQHTHTYEWNEWMNANGCGWLHVWPIDRMASCLYKQHKAASSSSSLATYCQMK